MIKGYRFKCSQESLLDERFAPNIEKQIISDVVNEIEESILACMAAGVPANIIEVFPVKKNSLCI